MGVSLDVYRCRIGLYNCTGSFNISSAGTDGSGYGGLNIAVWTICFLLFLITGSSELCTEQAACISLGTGILVGIFAFLECFHIACVPSPTLCLLILTCPHLWPVETTYISLAALICLIGFLGNYLIGSIPFVGVCLLVVTSIQPCVYPDQAVSVSLEAVLCLVGSVGYYVISHVPFAGAGLLLFIIDSQPNPWSDCIRTSGVSPDAFRCFMSFGYHRLAHTSFVSVYLTWRLIAVTYAFYMTGPESCYEQGTTDTTDGIALQILRLLLIIGGVESNPGPDSVFVCKVCKSSFPSITSYCNHFKIHLSTKHTGILCTHENCNAQLASLSSFRTHFSKFHRAKLLKIHVQSPEGEMVGSPCPCVGCSKCITSREDYLDHMKIHFLKGQSISFECIFPNCKTIMKSLVQFRSHISRYHPAADTAVFFALSQPKSTGSTAQEDDGDCEMVDNVHVEVENRETDEADVDMDPDCVSEEDLYPDYVIKDEMARFYLKLEAEEILATSTVQTIAEEIKLVTELIHYKLRRALRKELEGIRMEKKQIDQIVSNTFQSDPIFNIHHKDLDTEQLGTDHLRIKFWKKVYKFIEPIRVSLGLSSSNRKSYGHLVSIKESLMSILQDRNVKEKVLKSFESNGQTDKDILSDFTDGSAFNEHMKCHVHEGQKCLRLLIFQDGFDPNAFGCSGAYKPVGFYWTLGNLPAEVRSKLNLIQLAFMVLEKDLKNSEGDELKDFDRLAEALKPLINELIDLRTNGIIINGEKIPVCVLFLIGDSLGQNFIGRFVQNFSSAEFSCRFCPMSKKDFQNDPYETKPLRTSAQYNEYVGQAKLRWLQVRRQSIKAQKQARKTALQRAQKQAARSTAPSKKSVRNLQCAISKSALKKLLSVNFRGVKYRASPFNREDLKFHVAGNQPPCLAHDLFEGILKLVLPKILNHFINNMKWFDFVTLNRRINTFVFRGTDTLDKPKPLKSLESLSGHAVENWNFLRLLPFLIGDLIQDEGDPYWKLFLQLQEICAYVCAPKISLLQVEYLSSLIQDYLMSIKELLPECLTPKHHYLCHYPEMILRFGPLIRLFTLRFESKHAFFKRVIRSCKNYINVTYTMARKFMCRSAFDRSVSLLPEDIIYEDAKAIDSTSLPEDVRGSFSRDMEELEKVTICGTEYKKGQYLLLDRHEGTGLKVGCIKMVVLKVNSNEVLLLLEESHAINSFSGYYKIEQTATKPNLLQRAKDLADFCPLSAYSFNGDLCLSLKHTATFMN